MNDLDRHGYYLFLGLGDFPPRSRYCPDGPTPEWTCMWDVDEWRRRLDRLKALGSNILFLYLMGHRLPYPSAAYPEVVEEGHPNIEGDFLQRILDHANDIGIDPVAVFTTTGHAQGYSVLRPDLAVCNREGEPRPKRGILCHHREEARAYPLAIVRELLTRHGGFAGASLHPPEFVSSPCFCDACCAAYHEETGDDLRRASDDDAKRFFIDANLRWQRDVIEADIERLLPDARQYVFTVPPVFSEQFTEFGRTIPADRVIVEWDYDLGRERVDELIPRLQRYRTFGHEVWFMPTSGYAFPEVSNRERTEAENIAAVHAQVGRVLAETDVRSLVYFTGPHWWPTLEATSIL